MVLVGIDLAKNMFSVRGVAEVGKPARVRPAVPRAKPRHSLSVRQPP